MNWIAGIAIIINTCAVIWLVYLATVLAIALIKGENK